MARVLITDDDPDFVEITSLILKKEGHQVDSATSGDEALEKMRAQRPDVLILDVMMSTVLDGVNVSFEMAQDPALRSIPIIMISSIPDSAHAEEFPTGEYVPISAWLTKPVGPETLVKTVAKFVS